MALSKAKLAKYIERVERRNSDLIYGTDDVRGVSNNKEIQPTKADISNRSFERFQIVEPQEFVFNRRTTRMGDRIGLGYNDTNRSFIFTEDYVTFRVQDAKIVNPDYLYIFFRRPEFDRYVRFDSWGSATEFFNWEEMCDVTIALPPIDIQQKYVDVYNAMLVNQKAYEQGLDNLKLTCDAYLENLRRDRPHEKIGQFLVRRDEKNSSNLSNNVMGISVNKIFRSPSTKVNLNELTNYKFAYPRDIAFVQTTHNEKVFAYAFNNTIDAILVSSVNEVFSTIENELLPEYLSMFFSRTEFDRYARFHSWGSARETFTWSDLIDVQIPIPDVKVQEAVVNIYKTYHNRREINEKLKAQIKDLCPILIKGSLEEGRKAK